MDRAVRISLRTRQKVATRELRGLVALVTKGFPLGQLLGGVGEVVAAALMI
jgi:hypothetical protein